VLEAGNRPVHGSFHPGGRPILGVFHRTGDRLLKVTGNTIRFLHNYLPINVTVLSLAYVPRSSRAIHFADFGGISPSAELPPQPGLPGVGMGE
jgi:hypothetical protein